MNTKVITINSLEYTAVCKLRYQVFFEPHNLPYSILFDKHELHSYHVVVTDKNTQQILAYGRLTQIADHKFLISQMVVTPQRQGEGLGRVIIVALVRQARCLSAKIVHLEARLPAVRFYENLGFKKIGDMFASQKTEVLHINMQLDMVPRSVTPALNCISPAC